MDWRESQKNRTQESIDKVRFQFRKDLWNATRKVMICECCENFMEG